MAPRTFPSRYWQGSARPSEYLLIISCSAGKMRPTHPASSRCSPALNRRIHDNPYILIFNCRDEKAEESAIHLTGSGVERFVVKSKTVNQAGIEVTAEVRMKDESTSFVNRLNDIEGVDEVTLVSYNGEYMS